MTKGIRRDANGVLWTAGGRVWTPEETDRLHELVESGHSYAAIGHALNRSAVAVLVRCKRLGIGVTTSVATLSARDVAELLGLGCSKTVGRWIAWKWLDASQAGTKRKSLWRVSWEALTDFLEQPGAWMAWDPQRIADPAVQAWARELRHGQPCWLTPGDVAERCGVLRTVPNAWIAKGWLPAVRYGNWWIWSDDLDRFVRPSERHRLAPQPELITSAPPMLPVRVRRNRAILVRAQQGVPLVEIATQFGYTPSYISRICTQAGVDVAALRQRERDARYAAIVAAYEAHTPLDTIVRTFGFKHKTSLYTLLRALGVRSHKVRRLDAQQRPGSRLENQGA